MLILISNSPRILISRQTIDIEIDSSIAYRYAALHLLPCYHVFTYSVPYIILSSVPLLLCLYILCPLCHYGFCSLVTMSLHTLSIMSLWLPHHSVCHYNFCSLCHYGFCSFCLSSWLLSLMSLRLLFPCYFVFYILCPLCLPLILSGLEGLLCKVFLRTY